jgi:exodeoxyribonuclease VII small subunit
MSPVPNKPAAAPASAGPSPKGDFEKSLTRLEEVVKRMEGPDLSLDEAMKLFEEGVTLSRECQKQLEEAEGRVEILMKKADGKLVAEPFNANNGPSHKA